MESLTYAYHKAGLQSVDFSSVQQKISEISKNSKFTLHQQKKYQQRIDHINTLLPIKTNLENNPQELALETLRVDDMIHEIITAERSKSDWLKKVFFHVDMDAFFASVEMRDRPELRNIPMAVGDLSMLSTANYEARKFGVASAMPGYIAKRLCPELVIVPCNFEKYKATSAEIEAIISEYDPNYNMASLDEAYLEITDYMKEHPLMTSEQIASQLRDDISNRTFLTASVGIAANTRLAKLCSNVKKPNGQFCVPNDYKEMISFIRQIPIRKINGIGKATETVLNELLNISKVQDIFDQRAFVFKLLSPLQFQFLIHVALALGPTKIENNWQRKSIGVERTFQSTDDCNELTKVLQDLTELLEKELNSLGIKGKSVHLKYKTHEFNVHTRSKSLKKFIHKKNDLFDVFKQLLHEIMPVSLRLMGLRMTNLEECDTGKGILKFINKKKDPIYLDLTVDECIVISSDDE